MIVIYILAGIIALILILPLFMRKVHHVERSININVPNQKAFDYLKLIKNHDSFNKWAKAGERNEEYNGTDGTAGFIYAWSGNKEAGKGEKEIKQLIDGKKIDIEIRFVKPFKAVAQFQISTSPLSENQTKVTWSNTSALHYPLNLMVPMIERSLGKDMEESLRTLKSLLEKQ